MLTAASALRGGPVALRCHKSLGPLTVLGFVFTFAVVWAATHWA